MEQVIAFLVIFSMNFAIQSFPIENGFSVKFNLHSKDELRQKRLEALFGNIPQDYKVRDYIRQEVLTTGVIAKKTDLPSEYPNQMAKLLYPTEYVYKKSIHNYTKALAHHWAGLNFLNLPIVRQPFSNYKVLVATAPPNVRLGGENTQTFVYIVFPEEGHSDTGLYRIPIIYFVNAAPSMNTPVKKKPADPILIVDNNRTVTGIKSREVAKYLKFKSKFTNRLKYWLIPQ